ncbi:MAG: hypothetical protein RMJ87_01350 [Cytophagales bacterium]|nr:hypothetical protein [Bernardetiaceae bacterium]MDW8203647.1 hypothetical protein [Cytophagales bacterium]
MRIFGILALLLFIGLQPGNLQAQGRKKNRPTAEQRVELQTRKLTEELQLDAKQQEQVKAALQARVKATDELLAQAAADRQARLNKAREIQQNFNATMKGILNAEQQAKFEQLQAKRKEQFKQRRQKRGARGKHHSKNHLQDEEDLDDLEDFR